MRKDCCRVLLGIVLCGVAVHSPRVDAQGVGPSVANVPFREPASPVNQKKTLDALVTLSIRDVPLADALREITKQTGVEFEYGEGVLPPDKRVSMSVRNVSAEEAVFRMLDGTGVGLGRRVAHHVALITLRDPVTQETGSMTGRVIDSTSGDGIAGVTVTVQGTRIVGVTGSKGEFTLTNVATGEHLVTFKLLGYISVTRTVLIEGKKRVTVRVVLKQTANMLSGVVTTATGLQRKIEVGNDITQINVDSVMKVMPVATLTDLLATRVPGLVVASTSGSPGSPSLIRIRGVSSINATNDPIVIVDGIRKDAAQIDRSGNLVGLRSNTQSQDGNNQYVPSPLEQIDLNSIETVEVLKGPSAVALYGTDAANGVIVVITKRGQPGRRRWTVGSIMGWTSMPGKWPTNYWGYGSYMSLSQPVRDSRCSSILAATPPSFGFDTRCTVDSVGKYQILNDPYTTVFGTGSTRTYTAEVSGGTAGMTYRVTGSAYNELGVIKMPDADVALLEATDGTVPKWQRRPESFDRQHGSANVTMDLGRVAIIAFTTALNRTFSSTTPLAKQGIGIARGLPHKGIARIAQLGSVSSSGTEIVGSGLLQTIGNFRQRITSSTINVNSSVDVRGIPYPRLSYFATVGVDMSPRSDRSTFARDACFAQPGVTCGNNNLGFYDVGQGMKMITSLNLGTTTPIASGYWFSLKTSLGADYRRESTNDLVRSAQDIPSDAVSGNNGVVQSAREARDERTVAGVRAQVDIGLADRLFLPFAVRMDAGSGLGPNVLPKFPKLGFSYLLSDESFFQAIPIASRLSSLRLRTSYGVAGVQPSVEEKLRTYETPLDIVDGISVPTVKVVSLGNSVLRPERTAEWEWGLDVEALQGRLSTVLTWHHKRTIDLLLDVDVPVSVNGGGKQRINLGKVVNTGMELTVNATMLDFHAVGWSVAMGFSQNRNRLVKLGKEGLAFTRNFDGSKSTRFVEGYPLYGVWEEPLVGFTDINGDGWITGGQGGTPREVQTGTVPVYLGAAAPRYTMSVHNILRVFGWTIGTILEYQDGVTQQNAALLSEYSRALNDPSTPLLTQAYLAAAQSPGGSKIGIVQTVSSLRFNTLSIGYMVPPALTRALLSGKQLSVSLQGRNLGLWTNYLGKDPNVNSVMGEMLRDNGVLPTPRVWQLSLRIN